MPRGLPNGYGSGFVDVTPFVHNRGKIRLDTLLLERGMVATLQQARGLIMDGKVLVQEQRITKPGTPVPLAAPLRLLQKTIPWVSRGGIKLAHAIDHFQVSVHNAQCMDVGAATGGFTDVLLQRGAARVYALDVGYGQLAWKLAQDDRVVVMDRTNIRHIDPTDLPNPIDVLVMDVSFVGLAQALPPALALLRTEGLGIVLLKPQFELARLQVAPGGVVRDPLLHQEAITLFETLAARLGLTVQGSTPSPIPGPKGNKEFLFCFCKK
ncbi:MAG: TlyA family RNA methyltransferase [Magnetococcales bacterium]|nr:TlyA family RNA methyltransferase [Magnetococcales bacterium]